MNNLQVFNFNANEVRVIEKENGAWFCLKDVCSIVDVGNTSQLKTRLNQPGVITNEVGVRTGTKSDGSPAMQNVKMLFINESNLYKVIFQSRKEEAEQFTEYVTGTILPTIRKHGAYMNEQTLEQMLTNPDLIIGLATELKIEREKRMRLEQQPTQMGISKIEENLYNTTEVAAIFGMQARALNDLLRSKRIIKLTKGTIWNLNARYENKGYAKKQWKTLRWTDKGVEFLKKKLKT